MPQATNLRLARDTNQCPVGKGTVHDSLHTISTLTRTRAARLNILEAEKTKRINNIFEKNRRHTEKMATRVLERTRKSLNNLQAFRHILNNEYCVNNFTTMSRDFQRELVQTPRIARRYKLETRIYHSGYDINDFKPEISRRLRQIDPDRVHRIYQKVLLEKFKGKSDMLIDRNLSKTKFDMLLHDKDNLRKFTYQRKKTEIENSEVNTDEVINEKDRAPISELMEGN